MSEPQNSLFGPFSGPFTQFQKPFHGLPNELGAALLVLKNGVHAVQCAFGKARRGLFVIDGRSAHSKNIDDITNCYKGHFSRYHLLRSLILLISSKHQQRETDMLYRAHVEGFTGHFTTCEALKAWAEDLTRQYGLAGKTLKVWKATWIAKDGSGAQYNGLPTREIVIGA